MLKGTKEQAWLLGKERSRQDKRRPQGVSRSGRALDCCGWSREEGGVTVRAEICQTYGQHYIYIYIYIFVE